MATLRIRVKKEKYYPQYWLMFCWEYFYGYDDSGFPERIRFDNVYDCEAFLEKEGF